MTRRRSFALVAVSLLAAACSGGSSNSTSPTAPGGGGGPAPSVNTAGPVPSDPPAPGAGVAFSEDFTWQGDHAARVDGGGTTVWWNPDTWDVRSDTHSNPITPQGALPDGSPANWQGHDVSIHKARSQDPTDPTVDDSANVVGGDGTPGIGVMHVDFQGIESARLRNPLLIGADAPGVVSFYAPQFVTDGHWWEVAISPTAHPAAAEYTVVPGRQHPDFLSDPLTGSKDDGSTNGPGHRSVVEDSINLISTGYPDVPACPGQDLGWYARYGVTEAKGGQVTDHINGKGAFENLQRVDPTKRELHPWTIVYRPDKVELYSDVANSGQMSLVDSWAVDIPWSEVYVNFMLVAYQGDHHPNRECGWGTNGLTQAQDTFWRDIKVAPVKYARTASFPRDTSPVDNTRRAGGWVAYDLRDIRHHGQGDPNSAPYNEYQDYAYCSLPQGPDLCESDQRAKNDITLSFDVTDADLAGAARVQLIADIRYSGEVVVDLNGDRVGSLDRVPQSRPPSPSGDLFEPEAWQRKGIDVDVGRLHVGTNSIRIHLDAGTEVEIDRIEIETGAT